MPIMTKEETLKKAATATREPLLVDKDFVDKIWAVAVKHYDSPRQGLKGLLLAFVVLTVEFTESPEGFRRTMALASKLLTSLSNVERDDRCVGHTNPACVWWRQEQSNRDGKKANLMNADWIAEEFVHVIGKLEAAKRSPLASPEELAILDAQLDFYRGVRDGRQSDRVPEDGESRRVSQDE
jgi:hypothetical protein